MKTPEETITERNPTHGDFHDNADVCQAIKLIMRASPGWERLNAVEKESLEQDALKTSRILSGNPHEPEHWHDKAGYPVLVEKYLREGTTAIAKRFSPEKIAHSFKENFPEKAKP